MFKCLKDGRPADVEFMNPKALGFQIIIGCILIDIWHKATTLKVLLALMRGGTLYGRCKSKRMSGSANT